MAASGPLQTFTAPAYLSARNKMLGLAMIFRETMFDPLLAAYPPFEPKLIAFLDDWKHEPGEAPNYLLLADLARECVSLLDQRRLAEVEKILGVLEGWLVDGDEYVREAATVGFLEDLQMDILRHGMSPEIVYDLLGAESKYWWGKVEKFLMNGELLVDDRPC